LRALLSGKVPRNRRPHFRTLLEESPRPLIEGLVHEVGKWAKPGKVAGNVAQIASNLGIVRKVQDWLNPLTFP
jgi:hypothetical protein